MKSKPIVFLLAAALLGFAVLTFFVLTENASIGAFNEAFYAPIAEWITPALTTAATWIGGLTHWYSYAPIILLLLIIPATRMKVGLPMAIILSASAILGPVVLKNIFAIERPDVNQLIDPGGFGYPSGHSMNAVVFFGISAIMMLRYCKNRPLRIGFTIFAVIAPLLVGLSRIYLGVHVVTDVIGGFLAGTAVLCAAVLIERRIAKGKAA